MYIQHRMQEDAAVLHDILANRGGPFCLGGPRGPAGDVQDAIRDSLVVHGRMSKTSAEKEIREMKEHERYVLEVY